MTIRKLISVLVVALLFAYYTAHTFGVLPASDTSAPSAPPQAALQTRPDFSLPDLSGQIHTAGELNGKVVLINFWATWCPPCREEIPGFIALRERYAAQGFDILGIAIDNPEAIASFAKEVNFNYPVVYGQADASSLGRELGNAVGALPYSVLIDRTGIVRMRKAGKLSDTELEQELRRWL